MTNREAQRIVRLLIKAYEAGDSNETLAFYLQRELQDWEERVRELRRQQR